jgi:hypothetical protein
MIVLVPRPSTATSAATFSRRHRTSLIHYENPATQFLAVTSFDGMLRGGIIIDFHESKPSSLACKTIAHNRHRIDGYTIVAKESLHIRFAGRVREISHKKLLHLSAPVCEWILSRETPGRLDGKASEQNRESDWTLQRQ